MVRALTSLENLVTTPSGQPPALLGGLKPKTRPRRPLTINWEECAAA